MLVGERRNGYYSIPDETSQVLEGEETLECYGYMQNSFKCFVFHIFSILFAGTPYLILHWYCQYAPFAKYTRCSMEEAQLLLIKDCHNNYFLEKVITSLFSWPGSGTVTNIRYFHHCHVKYVWDPTALCFYRLSGLDDGTNNVAHLLDNSEGFTIEEQTQMLQLYGANTVDIEVKSYWRLFVEEVFNPFYLFQVFSVILWCLDDYYYYAGCVIFLSAMSITMALCQTKKQSLALRDLVAASNSNTALVSRKGGCELQLLPCTNQGPKFSEIYVSCGCEHGVLLNIEHLTLTPLI